MKTSYLKLNQCHISVWNLYDVANEHITATYIKLKITYHHSMKSLPEHVFNGQIPNK